MKYAIFLPIGGLVPHGQLSGNGLVKMNIACFDSVEEAVRFINETPHVASGVNYLILPIYEYRKPVPTA